MLISKYLKSPKKTKINENQNGICFFFLDMFGEKTHCH